MQLTCPDEKPQQQQHDVAGFMLPVPLLGMCAMHNQQESPCCRLAVVLCGAAICHAAHPLKQLVMVARLTTTYTPVHKRIVVAREESKLRIQT